MMQVLNHLAFFPIHSRDVKNVDQIFSYFLDYLNFASHYD